MGKKINKQFIKEQVKHTSVKHFMYVPFTGLGLHNGFRGNGWLKNRIKIFKQFVIPSLQAQTSKNFTLWVSWRREEKGNKYVKDLVEYLNNIKEFKTVHTYHGVCFYDDKYPPEQAYERLVNAIHRSTADLIDEIGEAKHVLMTIQPSDDVYHKTTVQGVQKILENHMYDAVGFKSGYICNYLTKEVSEYNPDTNPPFYTIKFDRETFLDPRRHIEHTALKKDSGPYKKGTPLPSHEYVGDCLRYAQVTDIKGFVVGTHSVNISTTFTNPYKGSPVDNKVLEWFGISDVPLLKIHIGPFKKLILKLPYKVQRKLRYIFGEWKWYKLSTYPGLLK